MDYAIYQFSKKEKIKYFLIAAGLCLAFGYLFYKNIIAVFFMIPIAVLYIKSVKKRLLEKRKQEFKEQFKDALLSASAVLQAGYSIENSFVHAYGEMVSVYGEKAMIAKELKRIINNINLNIPLEQSLDDLAKRTGEEDVEVFSEIFVIAKRCGGDMVKIISRTAEEISDKADIQSEIKTIISAKRFEQKIMNVMPLIIILYVNASTGGMLDKLYNNVFGIVVMSICLAVYLLAYYMAGKIVKIEV